jgi:hypothetical protein
VKIDGTSSSTIGIWGMRFQAVNLFNLPSFTNFDFDIKIDAPPRANNAPSFIT